MIETFTKYLESSKTLMNKEELELWNILGNLNKSNLNFIQNYNYTEDYKNYKIFQIPKRTGGFREICSPSEELKYIQRLLNQYFQPYYKEYHRKTVHGFVTGRSIVTNAKKHLNQKFVLNLDLKDFFPSIHFGRIKGLLMTKPFNFNRELAKIIANLCCYQRYLPQGAPTSPILTNMVCYKLDLQLQKLAIDTKTIYSRYADDITFSGRYLDERLAVLNTEGIKISEIVLSNFNINATSTILTLSDEIVSIIEGCGFKINHEKVRLQTNRTKQEVTGIKVNKKLNVERSYIRNIRAMLYCWETKGILTAESIYTAKYKLSPSKGTHFTQVLAGKINFVGQVRGKDDSIYKRFREKYLVLNGYKPQIEEKVESIINNLNLRLIEIESNIVKLKESYVELSSEDNRIDSYVRDSLETRLKNLQKSIMKRFTYLKKLNTIKLDSEKGIAEERISTQKLDYLSNYILQIEQELREEINRIELDFSSRLDVFSKENMKKFGAFHTVVVEIKDQLKLSDKVNPKSFKSIDFSFISNENLKDQLTEDNCEMNKNRNMNFKEFCKFAHYQIENLINNFFEDSNKIYDNWLHIERNVEKIIIGKSRINIKPTELREDFKNFTKGNDLHMRKKYLIIISYCYPINEAEPNELNRIYWLLMNIKNIRDSKDVSHRGNSQPHKDHNKEKYVNDFINKANYKEVDDFLEPFLKLVYKEASSK